MADIKAGSRLKFDGTDAEFVVTKGGEGEITLSADGEGFQLGKRYESATAGITLLCTKPGSGQLLCNGEALELQGARRVPSAD